jgi:hypothetical protein
MVRYREIIDCPDYWVGSDGSIWSTRISSRNPDGWKKLKPQRRSGGSGYHLILLRPIPGGKIKAFYVHRLVLEAFIGPCPEGMECRHLDGNPKNNRLDNLYWGTGKENATDRVRHGTGGYGEKNPSCKLSPSEVEEIKSYCRQGMSQRKVAKLFGVTQSHVSLIMQGKTRIYG